MDDERSDKDETDESEEEEEAGDKKDMKKNGPVQNGHTVHNNNHSKTEWKQTSVRNESMWEGLISLSRGAGGRDEKREEEEEEEGIVG